MKTENSRVFEKLFVLFLILEPINQALRLIIGFEAQFIFHIIYLFIIIINMKKIKNLKVFLAFVLFFAVSLCYSLLGYEEHLYNFFGLAYLIFIAALPWLLVGLNTKNIRSLFEMINNKLILILISNLILIFVCLRVKGELIGNMEVSYSILPLAVFSLYFFLESKKISNLLIFLTSLFVIIGFGSRGPLLCLLFFVFVYMLLNIKKHKYLFGFLILLSVFAFFNFKPILYNSVDFLSSHGIQSRTLYKMKNEDIMNDTGRSEIHNVTLDLIEKNAILGVGLGVERITINEKIYNTNKDMFSCYPHNLFMEIIVQYGWFLGGMICISIILLLLKTILVTRGKERDFIIMIISIEFIRLMISSSYISSVLFFYLIGLCIKLIKERKVNNEKCIDCGAV